MQVMLHQLVTAEIIAERCQPPVEARTVHQWRQRHRPQAHTTSEGKHIPASPNPFPEPLATIGTNTNAPQLWLWHDIAAWLNATRRNHRTP
jgi:hypothetical protein